jgi:serine kinase of HPr protein (carbohydrate metabolism regulator)
VRKSPVAPPSETIHATCVALNSAAILLLGPSGAGKSDLALRLIDRGASLVSDDYTMISRQESGILVATSPSTIAGKMEIRGIGIINMPYISNMPVLLAIELTQDIVRFPLSPLTTALGGVEIPLMHLNPFEESATIKAEYMARRLAAERGIGA